MSPADLIEQSFATYGELIREHARTRPDHPALIQDARGVSFAALDAMMDRVAATLQRDGMLMPVQYQRLMAHPDFDH